MIYFVHNPADRTVKIGTSWNPGRRLSTLQISTPSKLVLLGKFAGTKRVEREVHFLVEKRCGDLPGERPLRVSGEWFDDRVLPFVTELLAAPEVYFPRKPTKPAAPPAGGLLKCQIVLAADSGEVFREPFILKAATPEAALAALTTVADARLALLAHTVRITQLVVPGCRKEVSLRGAFVTERCDPREGASVLLNSEPGSGFATRGGVKQYADRWFHGVPLEFYGGEATWWLLGRVYTRATDAFVGHLDRFARVLEQAQCVIKPQLPLAVKGLYPRGLGRLPKGELRSKANQKVAARRQRRAMAALPNDGIVYFIQDTVKTDVKIGFCLRRPEKRLAALQTGNPNPLRLVGHVAGSERHERRLHKLFAGCHLHGEWFTSAVLADVGEILACASLDAWLRSRETSAD